MTRPMPSTERRALIDQYHGRRRLLAAAAHAHITFYEHHEGFAVDWGAWHISDAVRTVETPYPQFEPPPQCLCEEDFLAQILWHMVSQEPAEEPRHGACP
jgi:hypothetical protein